VRLWDFKKLVLMLVSPHVVHFRAVVTMEHYLKNHVLKMKHPDCQSDKIVSSVSRKVGIILVNSDSNVLVI